MTQAVYLPFDYEDRTPLNKTLPPELSQYISQEQWKAFCVSVEKAFFPVRRQYRFLSLLVCPLLCVEPLLHRDFYIPRLRKAMEKVCKEASDTKLPGLLVQFKMDSGSVLGPEVAVDNHISTYNFYLDIFLVRPNNGRGD